MRLFYRPWFRIAACSCLAAFGLWWPAFRRPFATGFGDWQFFHHMWEAGYVALTRYGEWPLWDPYHCGGITIFGNPQSQHMSPLYLLALLAGPTLGSKFFVVVHAWAGFAGMYVLARRYRLSRSAALLAALAWAASGFFVWHAGTGHAAFLPFYFAPWLLLALDAALRDLRWAAALAALLTWVLLEGGVYPFPFFVLLLAFHALLQLPAAEKRRPLALALLASALLAALMGALRLWPIADELARNPRTMPSLDAVTLREVFGMLTAREHSWRTPGHPFVWAEYGSFVGYPVCALALLGCATGYRRGRRGLVLGALLFLALLMGDHAAYWPWALLHRLPIFDSLRVPSRFCVFFTLYLALLAGCGLQLLEDGVRRIAPGFLQRRLAWLALALVAGIAVDIALVQYPTLDNWKYPAIRQERSPRFYLSELPYGDYYASFPRMNLGSRGCYEAMNFRPARRLWAGDVPQARVVSGTGTVGPVERTSSRAFFDVDLPEPGRVLINHNHAPGWRSNVGEVVSDQGRLAIDLPAGRRHIELRYQPTMWAPSIALSGLGCALGLLLWWQPWKRSRRRSLHESAAD